MHVEPCNARVKTGKWLKHLHGDVFVGGKVDAGVLASEDLVDLRLARVIGGKRVLLTVTTISDAAAAPAATATWE